MYNISIERDAIVTNVMCVKLIGWKDKERNLLVDPEEIHCLKTIGTLNEAADSIHELYTPGHGLHEGCVWKDIVLSPSRMLIQQELKFHIQRVESMTAQET